MQELTPSIGYCRSRHHCYATRAGPYIIYNAKGPLTRQYQIGRRSNFVHCLSNYNDFCGKQRFLLRVLFCKALQYVLLNEGSRLTG